MPIDASIYRDQPQDRQSSMLGLLGQLQSVQVGRSRNRLLDLQVQEAEDQMGQRDKLRGLLRSMDPSASAAGQAGQLQRGGFLKEGRELIQADALAQKTQREGEKLQVEMAGKRAELGGQLMSGARDQASYDAVRQQLVNVIGADAVARMPAQFDPQFAARVVQQSISTVDQAKQHLEMLKHQETVRDHDMDNRIAQGQLAVSQGQLGVARQNAGIAGANLGLRGQEMGLKLKELGLKEKELAMGGKPPSGYAWDPATPGKLVAVPGGPADESSKPLNDTQAKALLFGDRAKKSAQILDLMAAQGVNMPSQTKRFAEAIPVVGGALGALADTVVASPKQQRVEQAQRDIVNALLRRESGAAISASEFENAKQQYFPQIGQTDPELLRQKRENLRTAINGILAEVPQSRRPAALGGQGMPAAGAATTGAAPATDDPLGLRGGR